jgi:hypothetical protein
VLITWPTYIQLVSQQKYRMSGSMLPHCTVAALPDALWPVRDPVSSHAACACTSIRSTNVAAAEEEDPGLRAAACMVADMDAIVDASHRQETLLQLLFYGSQFNLSTASATKLVLPVIPFQIINRFAFFYRLFHNFLYVISRHGVYLGVLKYLYT